MWLKLMNLVRTSHEVAAKKSTRAAVICRFDLDRMTCFQDDSFHCSSRLEASGSSLEAQSPEDCSLSLYHTAPHLRKRVTSQEAINCFRTSRQESPVDLLPPLFVRTSAMTHTQGRKWDPLSEGRKRSVNIFETAAAMNHREEYCHSAAKSLLFDSPA